MTSFTVFLFLYYKKVDSVLFCVSSVEDLRRRQCVNKISDTLGYRLACERRCIYGCHWLSRKSAEPVTAGNTSAFAGYVADRQNRRFIPGISSHVRLQCRLLSLRVPPFCFYQTHGDMESIRYTDVILAFCFPFGCGR